MLSKWHVHAGDYARQAQENDQLEIRAVWDELPNRGREWAAELGVPFVEDLDTLLSNPSIDAVIVDTPTNIHTDVIVRAAAHGKHIFSEKVLALTTEEVERIFQAVDAAGVKLMLSLPRLCDPYYLYAQNAVDEGLLGQVSYVRCRIAHNGALPFEGHPYGWLPAHFFDPVQCGGGALIDLGAHPIYLTNRLGGKPTSVSATFSHFLGHDVEDNAVVTVTYDSGAIGVIESGFVSVGSPFVIEVQGTEGTLFVEETAVRIRSRKLGEGWQTPELPARAASAMEQWVDEMTSGQEPRIKREDMWWLTRVNEAAKSSADNGQRVTIVDGRANL